MGELYDAILPNHKCAAKLKHIAPRRPKIAAKERAHCLQHYVGPHDLRDGTSLQTKSPIGLTIGVSQAAEWDAVTVAQLTRASAGTRSDNRNRRAPTLELRPGIAQRAKVLVAEGSAEMAQEDKYQDLLAPQFRQAEAAACGIVNHNIGRVVSYPQFRHGTSTPIVSRRTPPSNSNGETLPFMRYCSWSNLCIAMSSLAACLHCRLVAEGDRASGRHLD